jgi:hypothetical protein
MNRNPTLCIAIRREPKYSETFIQAHIERLSGTPVVLVGNWKHNHNSARIIPFPLWVLLSGFRLLARQQGTPGNMSVRSAEQALGSVRYEVTEREQASRVFRRSLFVVQDIQAGEVFTAAHVRSIRPGYGLHTRHLDEVLGRRAARDIARGTPLEWDMVMGTRVDV